MSRLLTAIVITLLALPVSAQEGIYRDSLELSLPPLTQRGTIAIHPYVGSYFMGYSNWYLHQGLNASISTAAIFGLGKSGGSGFGNNVSLMYADNITPKLSFSLGGYSSFLEWGGARFRDAGMTGLLSYRFDEHWEASAFIQKSMVRPKVPPMYHWMADVGDKIGASVTYHFNPGFTLSVSVWNEYNR